MISKPSRVVIENVLPQVDGGRFPVKRVVGETVTVTADIHADGHDRLFGFLKYRPAPSSPWVLLPLKPLPNDAWTAVFQVIELGDYEYTLEAWIDRFATWRTELEKKIAAGQEVKNEFIEGAQLLQAAAARATGQENYFLNEQAKALLQKSSVEARLKLMASDSLTEALIRYGDRHVTTVYAPTLHVSVEPERARYGAWYEMFPRSAKTTHKHGATLRDAEMQLDYVARMGFDVLYLPPIHPIGKSFRKGPNNIAQAKPGDPGSPWAIGAEEGGHKAIHPDLGTLKDFDHFVAAARKKSLSIALDIAFQCSPDHPYVREHPEWFRHRPDGSIKYAENPPKKYEDIYPLDFECEAWEALWNELRDVVLFWISHGVVIFRVDNPHTKPYAFWEWMIKEIRAKHPETIFLAEAFTRPKVMAQLAKVGFSQSYSYFTWRNTKVELTEYFTELTQTPVREYMRPNLFVNTPDILHAYLQTGGRPASLIRLFLAATLGATYGIYGPAFELVDVRAIAGTEDYQDSEKYQIRQWDLDQPGTLREWITQVNHLRKTHPALQWDHSLRFHEIQNDGLLAYSKTSVDGKDIILTVINLDPVNPREGWMRFDVKTMAKETAYPMHELLSDAHYTWHGEWNFVRIDPGLCPAQIFHAELPS